MKTTLIVLAAFAGSAYASPAITEHENPQSIDTNTANTSSTLTIDISGMQSWGELDDPNNTLLSFGLFGTLNSAPSPVTITGYGFDVGIETFGPSWLSEPCFRFSNTDYTGDVFVVPGFGDDFAGTSTYSSNGIIDLVSTGDDFTLNPDNQLLIQLFESYNDNPGSDATYLSGSIITIQYKVIPAPGTLAMLGLGGLIAGRRQRK